MNDMKLEIVVIPVSDVDRAKEFYGRLGWRLDADFADGDDDPKQGSYRSFASFRDADGNGWLFQEITTRLAGRIDSGVTSFASANDLAAAFRRAETAHGEYEARLGQGRDANWPEWYTAYMVAEQAGTELPS